jgi:hypothetical protein
MKRGPLKRGWPRRGRPAVWSKLLETGPSPYFRLRIILTFISKITTIFRR